MPNLTSILLPKVEKHKFPGLNLGEEFILPHYENQSIINIPSTICSWMGIPEFGSNSLIPDIMSVIEGDTDRVILILMDALSFSRFRNWMEINQVWKSLAKRGLLTPLTSVVPSTTSSALTSLWTGVSPARHGVIGYEMWLREYSLVANMITHAPITFRGSVDSLESAGFSAEDFLGLQTFGTHLQNNGITPHVFSHNAIANSGLSRMLMKDVKVHPFHTPASMWVSIRHLIEDNLNQRMFIWTYWGQVDGISHNHGPDNERTVAEFSHYTIAFERYFLNQLSQEAKKGTLIILTADHGQTSTSLDPTHVLKTHPELNQHLRMKPTCENRLAFLYIRPGYEENVREYFHRTWPDKFTLISGEEAISEGLFGPKPHHPELVNRVGDLLVICRGSAYLWWADEVDFLLGRHGGLNKDDMIVPFLVARV